jgi:hypothetical protein
VNFADKALIREAQNTMMWITDCQGARYLAMVRPSVVQKQNCLKCPTVFQNQVYRTIPGFVRQDSG